MDDPADAGCWQRLFDAVLVIDRLASLVAAAAFAAHRKVALDGRLGAVRRGLRGLVPRISDPRNRV